jgi:hypothetical protein
MTKLRTPLSFSRAITTIAAAIGWEAAAKVTGRSVRTVRHWSESDRHGTPTLDQALALDRAFIAAGGDHGPILSSYGLQLDVALVDAVACRTALAEDIAATTRETGDAISHCIQALHPGATPAQIYRAIAETEEADALFPRLLGRLKPFCPALGPDAKPLGKCDNVRASCPTSTRLLSGLRRARLCPLGRQEKPRLPRGLLSLPQPGCLRAPVRGVDGGHPHDPALPLPHAPPQAALTQWHSAANDRAANDDGPPSEPGTAAITP